MLSIPRRWLPWLVASLMLVPTTITWIVLIKEGKPAWMGLIIPLIVMVVVLPLVRGMVWFMGWDRLARQFAEAPGRASQAQGEPAWADTVASVALRKPWLFMNNCVRYACDETALTLAIEHPFRLGTPTIRMAWSRLGTPAPVAGHAGLVEIVEKDGSPLTVRLFVPEELLRLRTQARS